VPLHEQAKSARDDLKPPDNGTRAPSSCAPRNAFYGKSRCRCVSGRAPKISSAMDNHLLPWAWRAFRPARESAAWRWLSAPRSALLSYRLRERKGAPALADEKDPVKTFHPPTKICISRFLRVRMALSLLYSSIWKVFWCDGRAFIWPTQIKRGGAELLKFGPPLSPDVGFPPFADDSGRGILWGSVAKFSFGVRVFCKKVR